MAFRYPLQSLLRLRESIEHQEEQRLFAAASAVVQIRTKLEELERERMRTHVAAWQELDRGTFGATLQFVEACDSAASQTSAKLRLELVEAERRRLEQLHSYQKARQKRQMFEGLRDQQKASYDLERAHRDQELVDEAFLMRRHFRPSE
jgi:flagellar export protein FliJ